MVDKEKLHRKLSCYYGKDKNQELPEIILTADEACFLSAMVMLSAGQDREEIEKLKKRQNDHLLHTHPGMEKRLNVPDDHVIIDRELFEALSEKDEVNNKCHNGTKVPEGGCYKCTDGASCS